MDRFLPVIEAAVLLSLPLVMVLPPATDMPLKPAIDPWLPILLTPPALMPELLAALIEPELLTKNKPVLIS
jgi:hypothetical protein